MLRYRWINKINKIHWPERRIRSRWRTRSDTGWTRSSCRRSTWETCTFAGRTIVRGRAAGAPSSRTEPWRSRLPVQPACLPVRWYRRQCAPLSTQQPQQLSFNSGLQINIHIHTGASTPHKRWSKCTMKKIGGEGFCRNLAYLGGEVRKLLMHFAGHQVSDFKAKMHQIRFRLGLRPRPPSWI